MHVCENNCALTLEDEIKFWGLDDALLQVAATFAIYCVSSVYLFEIIFRGDAILLQFRELCEICNMLCLLCLSAVYYFILAII